MHSEHWNKMKYSPTEQIIERMPLKLLELFSGFSNAPKTVFFKYDVKLINGLLDN